MFFAVQALVHQECQKERQATAVVNGAGQIARSLKGKPGGDSLLLLSGWAHHGRGEVLCFMHDRSGLPPSFSPAPCL